MLHGSRAGRLHGLHQANCQQIDHPFRICATIDVVTDIDLAGKSDWPAQDVFVDAGDDLLEKVCAAMNVADDVDACLGRQRRLAQTLI